MSILKLTPGKCRHLLTIKYNSKASTDLDSLGRETITEATLATIKAEFRKLAGDERIVANQEFGFATHELMTWYVPGVTNFMWVTDINSKRYNIVDITNIDEKDHQLYMILASESS
jgi:SPP1 family predicted phage head-tail adaptor